MRSFVTALLFGAVLSLPFAVPAPAAADDYWDNHWSWYDNTYRPYYYRYPQYSTYGRYYAPGYYGPGYYGSYYGPSYGYYSPGYGYGYGGWGTPYRTYYGTSDFGYGRTYGGGQAVNIGGLQFGWR